MKQLMKLAVAAALGAIASGSIVYAQAGSSAEPPHARIALYRAAPGQQVALLKWLAAQDRVSQSIGLPASKLYAHTDGDSWDYLAIDPVTTPGPRQGARRGGEEGGAGDRPGFVARVPQICVHAHRHVRDRAGDARAISRAGRAVRVDGRPAASVGR